MASAEPRNPLQEIVAEMRRAGYEIAGKTDAELRAQCVLAWLDMVREHRRKQSGEGEGSKAA